MTETKLVSQEEMVELFNLNNANEELVYFYKNCNNEFGLNEDLYCLNNTVTLDDNHIITLQLNYYCKKKYKFLFPYKIENDVEVALSNFKDNILKG